MADSKEEGSDSTAAPRVFTSRFENEIDRVPDDGLNDAVEKVEKKEELGWKDAIPQLASSCLAQCIILQNGFNFAFSAILLPKLMGQHSTIPTTIMEASWIASLYAMATPVASICSGPLMDWLGRRNICLVSCVPFVLSWLLIASTTQSVWPLYVARLLSGLGSGLTVAVAVYISEICHMTYRPMLLSLVSVFMSLAILLTAVMGIYLDWHTIAICFAFQAALNLTMMWLFTPESPYWFINFSSNKKRTERAQNALKKLYKCRSVYADEMNQLLYTIKNKPQCYASSDALNEKSCNVKWYNEVLKRSTVAPLTILLVLLSCQQMSGGYVVTFYGVQIFQEITGDFGSGIDEYEAMVLMGLIRLVVSCIMAGLSRLYGRRPLLLISKLGMAVSSFAVIVYFQLERNVLLDNFTHVKSLLHAASLSDNTTGNWTQEMDTDMSATTEIESVFIHWMFLFCVLAFVGMSAVGELTIPWTLTVELLPTPARGFGCGFLVAYAYILMFFAVKTFPFIMAMIGISGIFVMYSIVSMLGALFVYFFLPETFGKSLTEIEMYFVKKQASELKLND